MVVAKDADDDSDDTDDSQSTNYRRDQTTSEHKYTRRSVPVERWGLKFNGETSVVAFLERVQELSIARHVSPQELWESALDLFEGTALIWFRGIRKHHYSWKSLAIA